jgi:hypothetical protein
MPTVMTNRMQVCCWMCSSLIKNCGVVSGLEHAEGVVVTRHLKPNWTTAAGHTNSLARIRKTHRNLLKGFNDSGKLNE